MSRHVYKIPRLLCEERGKAAELGCQGWADVSAPSTVQVSVAELVLGRLGYDILNSGWVWWDIISS